MKKIKPTICQLEIALLMLFTITSCMDDTPQIPLGEFEKGVLIMNEGAFGANDGEVYHYDQVSGEIKADIFERKNGRPFAGLIQDMVASEGRLYLVANTGKVEIVDPRDFASMGAVSSGLDISRSLVTANQKIYISDWGPYDANFNSPDSYIAVVGQLDGGAITKKIPVSSRPEGMYIAGNQLLVACTAAQKLDIISLSTDEKSKSLDVTGQPIRFFEAEGKLYLFSRDAENIYFHEVNRSNAEIIDTKTVNLVLSTSIFVLADNAEILIITSTGWPEFNDAIARVDISSGEIVNASIFTGSGLYGIGYDADRREIYVADNNGFQGNGTVIVLDQSGQQQKTFVAGRGPSGFMFN
jgi:DNA-binding beta-propeller fold protein YncE